MDEESLFGLSPDQLEKLFSACTDGEDGSGVEGGEPAPAPDAASAGPLSSESPSDTASLFAAQVGTRIDRYKLLGVLGEGGMGVVYLAEQEHPIKRHAALKVIKPGMDSQRVIARFEAERQALALLDHPNIAHVLDAGTTEQGRPYFVMEYVEGLPITEYCDQNKLSVEERLRLFVQVCQAVHHAHQKGFIHRDIKPSNILVTVQDGQAVPKIIDFGVARALSSAAGGLTEETLFTQQGQLVGTPEYMSPEQIDLAHEAADTRSDIYSLGVLLYVLLTGVMPFDPKTFREGGIDHIRQVIREHDPKTPSTRLASLGEKAGEVALNRRTDIRTLARNLHKELEWIPLKAMRKERQQRYQSAAELAQDIRNYLDGVPLIAGPPSRSYRIKKFVKRNRTLVSAAVIVGLTIAIGSIVSLTMYVRAQVQAQRSEAVSSFLNDSVLLALDPRRPQGGEVSVRSVLDAVSDAMEGRFRSAPLIEAQIRHRLGATYRRIGAEDVGATHLQRALDIRRQQLGNNDLLTVESMLQLGTAYYYQSRNNEAQPLFLDAVAQKTRQLGEEDDRTLVAKMRLAWNYKALGENDKAMQLYQEVLNSARRVGGDEHEPAILAIMSIGVWHAGQGHYDEAEKWLRKAVQLSGRVWGQKEPATIEFTSYLGWVYLLQGRYAEAESVLQDTFVRQTRIFGEGTLETLLPLQWLIYLYAVWDRPEDARKWRAKLVAAKPADAGSLLGSIRYDENTDTYAIRGSGMDIWDIFDEFHFAHKMLQGDGSITARIDSLENTNPWAKSGVMIRKTLEPTSEHASIFITPASLVAFQYRSTPRGVASSRHAGRESVKLPHWVRLTRRGNTFTAEHSSDGMSWEEVRSPDPNESGPVEIAMDETVHVGLAVTSHNAGRAATARIAHVTSTGDVSPAGPFTISEDIGLQTMWPSPEGGSLVTSVDANSLSTQSPSEVKRSRFIDGEIRADDIEALTIRHGVSVGSIQYEDITSTYTIVASGTDIWGRSDEFHFAQQGMGGQPRRAGKCDTST